MAAQPLGCRKAQMQMAVKREAQAVRAMIGLGNAELMIARRIAEIMRLLACWTGWARENGYGFATIREAYAASFALIKTGYRRRYRGDMGKDAVETAKLFIAYLEDRGALERPPVPSEPALLSAFMAWARDQHGLAESTLGTYGRSIRPFIAALGEDPARYDATSIRNHMLARAKTVSAGRLKGIRTAIRAFLRFLIACGRCPPGLDHAMPKAANWQLATLPRYLQEADIVRVLAACEGEQRLRDRAIILLLARLGLPRRSLPGGVHDTDRTSHHRLPARASSARARVQSA